MRMGFMVILATRTTVKVSDFLPIFLSHACDSVTSTAVATDDAALPAEATAASDASAVCYRFPEHVGVVPVVVAEHELVQVEREVFSADVVIRADDAALQERPEVFDGVRVDVPPRVFAVNVP